MIALAAIRVAAGLGLLAALHTEAAAHGLGQRYDLPLPLNFYLLASGAAVAVSFVILAVFMRRPQDASYRLSAHPLLHGTISSPVVIAVQILSVAILALLVAAGLFGRQNPFKNITPVTTWVIYWVGVTLLSAFVGNLWPLLSPWTAAFDFAESAVQRLTGKSLQLHLPYPARLSAWPACILFLILVWFELVATDRDVPRYIATALIIYSGLTWAGFVIFGRDIWNTNGEAISVALGLFGRFAPLRVHRDQCWHWSLHPYGSGLLAQQPLDPAMTAFTLLILGSVTVDGLMETPLWAATAEWLLGTNGASFQRTYSLLATALLVAGPLALAALYLFVIALMTRIAGGKGFVALAGLFVLTLVPIAIAYHLAHYFSLLMIAGQFIIPLASDPFGFKWDLFGTTLYRIDISIVDARFIWYLSVIAIVCGHIIAVWLAHVIAFRIYYNASIARRSQYPMLALMIGYTMLSLWILAQPIVEPAR